MLRLKNIKMENNIIEADYYPESEKVRFGHVAFNTKTREEKIIMAEGYDREYPFMAVTGLDRLVELFNNNEISELPKERTVMWY